MRKYRMGCTTAIFLFLAGFSGMALAGQGYSRAQVNVRAGPGINYPVVDRIGANRLVNIYGCVSGWSWCEIERKGVRGWVSASRLSGIYNNRRVPIIDYGPQLSLPFMVFEQRSYWDRYYRDRDFYHDNRNWHQDSFHPYHNDYRSNRSEDRNWDRDSRSGNYHRQHYNQ